MCVVWRMVHTSNRHRICVINSKIYYLISTISCNSVQHIYEYNQLLNCVNHFGTRCIWHYRMLVTFCLKSLLQHCAVHFFQNLAHHWPFNDHFNGWSRGHVITQRWLPSLSFEQSDWRLRFDPAHCRQATLLIFSQCSGAVKCNRLTLRVAKEYYTLSLINTVKFSLFLINPRRTLTDFTSSK
jgi:hypothetical protein